MYQFLANCISTVYFARIPAVGWSAEGDAFGERVEKEAVVVVLVAGQVVAGIAERGTAFHATLPSVNDEPDHEQEVEDELSSLGLDCPLLVLVAPGGQLPGVFPNPVSTGVSHGITCPAPVVEGPHQVHHISRLQI